MKVDHSVRRVAKILKMGRKHISILLVLILYYLLSPVSAATVVSTCQTISGSGSYVMNMSINNAAGTCITISSSDVIFDGAGFTVDGTGSGSGIAVTNTNITVRNVTVTGFNFGFEIDNNNNSIENSTIMGNNYNFYMSGDFNNISNNIVQSSTFDGFFLSNSIGNNITNNTIRFSTRYPIWFRFAGTVNNSIYNNLFNNTGYPKFDNTNPNFWNTSKTLGDNIFGGPYLGGNFWANPSGTGFSETCTDTTPADGICDTNHTLATNNIDLLPLSNYTPDLTPPILTLHSPMNGSYNSLNLLLNTSADEVISAWWYSLNSGANTTFTPNTTIAATEGSNTLIIWANDTSGNEGTLSISFTVDTTNPSVTISSPLNQTYPTANVDLNVSSDETVGTWWYSLNSGANTTFTPNTTIIGIEGANTLIVFANDSIGNVSQVKVYFTIDTQAPSISSSNPSPVERGSSSNLTLNISDANPDTYMIFRNSSLVGSGTYTSQTPFTEAVDTSTVGIWNYTIWANDTLGNVNTTLYWVTVQDTTPPAISIQSPGNTTYPSTSLQLNVSANETVSTWLYNLNGGSNRSFAPNTTITAGEGVNNITVYANDSSGNWGSAKAYFTVIISDSNTSIVPANATSTVINGTWLVVKATANESLNATVALNSGSTKDPGLLGISSLNTSNTRPTATKGIRYLNITNSTSLTNVTKIRIEVYYNTSELTGLDENDLALYYWNGSYWISTMSYVGLNLPGGGPHVYSAGRNTTSNYVYAEVDHLSVWAVGGSPPATPSSSASTGDDDPYKSQNPPRESVLIVANSIDMALATDFMNYLARSNINVKVIAPEEFTEMERASNRLIILLGGPDSPEGEGEIAQEVLTMDEEEHIRSVDSREIIVKYDPWTDKFTYKQIVVLIGGHDRFQTQQAMSDHKEEAYSALLSL